MIHKHLAAILLAGAIASPASAHECGDEVVKLMRHYILAQVAEKYAGRGDASLQFELAMSEVRRSAWADDETKCRKLLDNIRTGTVEQIERDARTIVGTQKVLEDARKTIEATERLVKGTAKNE